jgi:lipopolysaccharide/colanic/teichoic acid biosynthesis glycosyltransferase
MQNKKIKFNRQIYYLLKNIVEYTLAMILIVVFAPVMVLSMIAIKLYDKGPVIYKQRRIGKNKSLFTLYKLRTMVPDADSKKKLLQHLNEATPPIFKIRNDPRVTPVGKILRKLSIDELPQLFNVLNGDMYLIGPRPQLPEEVAQYERKKPYLRRFCVEPGIVCLAQVEGRSLLPFHKWMAMDRLYIVKRSLSLDMYILYRTILAIITRKGAY